MLTTTIRLHLNSGAVTKIISLQLGPSALQIDENIINNFRSLAVLCEKKAHVLTSCFIFVLTRMNVYFMPQQYISKRVNVKMQTVDWSDWLSTFSVYCSDSVFRTSVHERELARNILMLLF